MSSVVDVGLSDHYCVFFKVKDFIQQDIPERTVRKRYLTSEVAANFSEILKDAPKAVLPSSCDFIVDHFNWKLRSTLDSVAPINIKRIKSNTKPPWRTNNVLRLKRECRIAERRWRKNKLTVHF